MPIVTNSTQSPQNTTSTAGTRSGRFTTRAAMAIATPTLLLGATLAAPAAQASLNPSQSDATQSVTQIDSSSALSSLTNANKNNKATDTPNDNKVLPTGANAVKHAAAELEKKAGHKLFDLVVHSDKQVHVHFAEDYDLQTDGPALAELSKVAEANGIALTADR